VRSSAKIAEIRIRVPSVRFGIITQIKQILFQY
jgi:hypothetical protein